MKKKAHFTVDDMEIGKKYLFTGKDDEFIGMVTTTRGDPRRVLNRCAIVGGCQSEVPITDDVSGYTITPCGKEMELEVLGQSE